MNTCSLNKKIKALPIVIGSRTNDKSDFDELDRIFHKPTLRQFSSYDIFFYFKTFHDLNDIDGIHKMIKAAGIKAESRLKIKLPLAIFLIMSWDALKISKDSVSPLDKKAIASSAKIPTIFDNIFIYKIIMDIGENPSSNMDGYTENEILAHKINFLYSYYNDDFPSIGVRRLVEAMNRIMGTDLPQKIFPNYSWEELKLLLWHTNRENFNYGEPRDGALPKYEIKNGKAVFKLIP